MSEAEEDFLSDYGRGNRLESELPQFREAFRQIVLDSSRSFTDKAAEYLRVRAAEDRARRYFEDVWDIMMDEPWPFPEESEK